MEALLFLLLIYLFAALVVMPIWAFLKFRRHETDLEVLERQVGFLEAEVRQLRTRISAPTPSPVPAAPPPQPAPLRVTPTPPVNVAPAAPLPVPVAPAVAPSLPVFRPAPALPPVIVAPPLVRTPGPVAPRPSINWEQFMGAKLFAWLGGLALFLGVAFFVKYSFEHDLIPPEVRVALGFLLGAGLIVGGLRLNRERYRITCQTLIASGVVSLYAVTFACNSVYHFAFFGVVPTFLLMTLITATAFVLSVRLEAQVVAILGILGGFLTPVLLSTGVDNPGGLFGYLALLDVGLVAVALHRSWFHLVPLGAAGTVIMMIGWAGKFYAPEKTMTAMLVCLGFSALFLTATEVAKRVRRASPLIAFSSMAMPAVAFSFAAYFLGFPGAAMNPALFFGFVFLVSAACLVLAWREALPEIVAVAGGAVALLMFRWFAVVFEPDQAPVVVVVSLFFSAVFFGAYLVARTKASAARPVLWTAVGMPVAGLAFSFLLLDHAAVAARPLLIFGFILASDALLLAVAWLDDRLPKLPFVAGLAVFGLLSLWTTQHLTDALLPWALAAYLLFAGLHAVFPVVLARRRPDSAPTWWSQLFPPLTLVLMLIPFFKLETVSFLLWPAILVVDVLAIALALLSATLVSVGAVLVLTLVVTGLGLFRVPVGAALEPSLLLVLGGFAVFFFAACLWLARRLGDRVTDDGGPRWLNSVFGDTRAQLPAFSSLLPFLLLIMATARLAVPDPGMIFGLGLLLVGLTLGLARLMMVEWLPACALAGIAGLQYAWHGLHFDAGSPSGPLMWSGIFYAVFTAYPFVFRRAFAGSTGPWAVAALSGVAHFPMVYRLIERSWPNPVMGLLPVVFAVAPLASLVALLRAVPADHPQRLNQLAWFGGVALFFITLIFPIQFDRQWLTVAWALEGAALCWLFHRVPHPGLRLVGVALLLAAFARLALNPSVLAYHARSATPLLNWYLYAYGLTTAALFAGARLLAPPRERWFGLNVPPLLNALGVVLAFLLLNIEIADFFAPPGARVLTFQFSGNFARDMTYTIAWALFALGLLGAGIWKEQKAARYAAIALLSVVLLKLFFHDLARLEALYRIGALFAVAVIAIVASFAYQRFLPGHEKSPPTQP